MRGHSEHLVFSRPYLNHLYWIIKKNDFTTYIPIPMAWTNPTERLKGVLKNNAGTAYCLEGSQVAPKYTTMQTFSKASLKILQKRLSLLIKQISNNG